MCDLWRWICHFVRQWLVSTGTLLVFSRLHAPDQACCMNSPSNHIRQNLKIYDTAWLFKHGFAARAIANVDCLTFPTLKVFMIPVGHILIFFRNKNQRPNDQKTKIKWKKYFYLHPISILESRKSPS